MLRVVLRKYVSLFEFLVGEGPPIVEAHNSAMKLMTARDLNKCVYFFEIIALDNHVQPHEI